MAARAGALPGLEPCQGWSPAKEEEEEEEEEEEDELQTDIYIFRLWVVALQICAGLAEGASTNY